MDNSLAKVHPELVCEWSDRNLPITADMVTFGSNKMAWWKGICGHEWETSIKARSNGEGCPICSGARAVEGINDLATLKPDLAKEWSDKNKKLKPTMVTIGSSKKVIWIGKCGHEWIATVKNRALTGSGCPYCSHNKILEGFNDLASQMPALAEEWSERNNPLSPKEVMVFSNRKAWWKCKDCGNEWHTLISTRSGGSKCPYCSGIILLKGFNDLATTHPDIASEWSDRNLPLTADSVNHKSRKNVWWHCNECGTEWKGVIHSRINGRQCPVCAEQKVLSGYNDLETTDSEVLSEWDYDKNTDILPSQVTRNSMRIVWWKCGLGHSYREKIAIKVTEEKKCPICEEDFRLALPRLMILFYCKMENLKVKSGSDDIIGIPLETYIEDEKLVIESEIQSERIEDLKLHLCNKRGIKLEKVPFKKNDGAITYANKIKAAFMRNHIFITSNTEEDVTNIRRLFFEWRVNTYEKK